MNAQATNGSAARITASVRRYEKVLDDGRLADAKGWKVGDRVLVSLDIQAPRRASYVAVNDPLPAVLEAINPEFKTQDGGNVKTDGDGWWVSELPGVARKTARCSSATISMRGTSICSTSPGCAPPVRPRPRRRRSRRCTTRTGYAETAAGKVNSAPLD